jgi:hypothetical protein
MYILRASITLSSFLDPQLWNIYFNCIIKSGFNKREWSHWPPPNTFPKFGYLYYFSIASWENMVLYIIFILLFIVKIVQFEPHAYKIVSDIELIIIIILNKQIIDPHYNISCLCLYKIEILSLWFFYVHLLIFSIYGKIRK